MRGFLNGTGTETLGRNQLLRTLFICYTLLLLRAGVAQLFRARPCQGRGQGLESPHPHH